MLQISGSMRAHIDHILQRRSHPGQDLRIDPMIFHIVFISAVAANWQEYLEYLQSQIAIFVNIYNHPQHDTYANFPAT